jgi:glucose uptake protein GlcU
MKITGTFLCGLLYAAGLNLSLRAMVLVGLTISQPLQSSINLFTGTLVTSLIGGRPPGFTADKTILSVSFLVLAVVMVTLAERAKSAAQGGSAKTAGGKTGGTMKTACLLLILASLCGTGYSFGISYGLVSVTQPAGLTTMPYMCVLCTGACFGTFAICGAALTKRRQWRRLFTANWGIHKWGVFSGLMHYGGNILHTYATGALSSPVSFPLGLTCGLWTQAWGLVYGEFKNAPARAYVFQGFSFACYILGAYITAG